LLVLIPAGVAAQPQAAVQAPTRIDIPGINNFFKVNDTIACGGMPTIAALDDVKNRGYKAIINMRSADEPGANVDAETAAAHSAGLRYVHIPTSRANVLTPENVDRFLAAVGAKENHPVFVHCGSGHRVSAYWMIKRVRVDGWTVERALAEAQQLGLNGPLQDQTIAFLSRRP
jgi:uncharacterized protein (TIGR01244 family)